MIAHPLIGQLFFFVGKFLEFLKPFFQKGFKRSTRQSLVTLQVRTESATFPRDLLRVCYFLHMCLFFKKRIEMADFE